MSKKTLSRDSYRVGWICPLEVEQTAAMEMLDEEHNPLPQPKGDTNIYNLGSINGHNIVIAGLPTAGNCQAATVATQMRMTFQNLKYCLLVGIGGEVVVSQPTGTHSGAIQYDHGKAKNGHFERKGCLAPPPTALLNAVRELFVRRQRMGYDPVWENTKRIRSDRPSLRHFKYPGAENDYQYVPYYEHQTEGATCEEGGCDPKYRTELRLQSDSFVVVHRGTIASGELVIKDAKKRDELAKEYGVLCFEMEAAGVLTDFPCLVIRGISDYCDSHKNDIWHGWAAAVAAAYARQLFFHIAIEEQGHSSETPTFDLPLNRSELSEVTQFVARQAELKKMDEILGIGSTAGRRTAILCGLGGIGKTQSAIAYMKRHRESYSARIWLNARDETSLKQSFTSTAKWILRHHSSIGYIAYALESQDLDQVVNAVKRWLEDPKNDRWLLVFDNYDNPLLGKYKSKGKAPENTASLGDKNGEPTKAFDLRLFLPETDHGAIIVTTRSSMVKLGQVVPLSKLENIDDSIRILASVSRRSGTEQDSAARDLAKQLDGLPLALATAGAYLEQVSLSYAEYLQLYHESWRQLQEDTPQLAAYDQNLYSTWNISYEQIQQKSPIAAKLLQQWAYFNNEDLWYELLQDEDFDKPQWLEDLTKDKLSFHRMMRILCSYGLVEAQPTTALQGAEGRGYSVHGCVHSWMIYVLNTDINNNLARVAIERVAAHVPSKSQPEFWLMERRLIPHADRCIRLLSDMRDLETDSEVARALPKLGALYSHQDRFLETEKLYKMALKWFEKQLGQDHAFTIYTLNELGNLYAGQGRFQEAETMFEQALKGPQKASVCDIESSLIAFNGLGNLYSRQGSLQKAEAIYKRALEGYEKAFGQEHMSTLNTFNNLGVLYLNQGRFHEAEVMYKRVLEGKEKTWERGHISTLDTVNNLGVLHVYQGRFQEAQVMYERALEGFEKTLGQEHPSTLDTVHNLGALYLDQGRFQEAEAMYKRVLNGKENLWGREHISTLSTVNNLGALYARQRQFQEAEEMYERAREGYEKALGLASASTYPPALHAYANSGALFAKQGEIEKAVRYFKLALSGYETIYGRDGESFREISSKLERLKSPYDTESVSSLDETTQRKRKKM